VLSDTSAVFPLARAEASGEGASAAGSAAAATSVAFGGLHLQTTSHAKGAGVAELLLLFSLLAGLAGMLASGVLAALQP
jgi:hypothetical protein